MSKHENDRRRFGLLALVVGASLLLAGCTPPAGDAPASHNEPGTPFSAEATAELDAALAAAMTLAGASGAEVGVWAPWAGEWTSLAGTTTAGGSRPLKADMTFRIGTNTTAMTCTVLLKLVDEKRVALTDPVSKYLTRMPDIDGITLGQLCQGTSGLPDYYGSLHGQFVNNPQRQWPPLEVISAGMGAGTPVAPGSAWASSTTGIVLLGMALQAATNTDWPTLYQKYIFEPLNLTGTSFPAPDDLVIPGSHPNGYAAAMAAGQPVCETKLDETSLSNSMFGVAGGVISTIGDMKVWTQALAEGSLLSKKSAKAQWATVPSPNGPEWKTNGLGTTQVGPLRGSYGSIPGFITAGLSDPSSGLTIVVMLNDSTAGANFAYSLALQLASIAAVQPAVKGQKAPELAVPWSAEDAVAAMQAAGVCPTPVPPPAEPTAEPAP
ncbi:serine hydrolase domain-containing protein [Glaciibacter psychrotolerans]|uniref:D-alanyl-D-alanine carboxypeptidase n=1 Tax=Glaciibacter psychrotolerans TaxID=670054 RepID=A0A7Z0EG71_9MICO|nr:serine hydrolase domain-containing protein [Leifsonia psychrotolerans]NYJ21086.1 D-alanyl-D-alanine carboxypeptidase [Leifsonia psychrotolerans]